MDPCSRHRHLDGVAVTTPARPIPATISVDRLTTSQQLSEFAQFEYQLDGTQPFVRVVRVDASCAVLDLLPPEASIERCVTTDNSVAVLARLPGASLHIEAWPRRASRLTDERLASLSAADDFGGAKTMRAKVIRELINEIRALRDELASRSASAPARGQVP